MKAKITWQGQAKFLGQSGSGHEVMMDGPPDHGGENAGPRPMEMMLLSIGGCATFDIIHILKKSRQLVESCEIDIAAERADAIPAIFTKIHLHFKITGAELQEKQVARAVQLSAEKYCSASIMLQKAGVIFTHDYEILKT